jgi:hypothetical protein
MKQIFKQTSLLLVLALGASQQAMAHVSYTNLNSYNGSSTGIITETLTDYGWNLGNTSKLAGSDDLGWYTFTLSTASLVSLSVNTTSSAVQGQAATDGVLLLDSIGLSLYSGKFVAQSFDDNPTYSVGVSAPYPLNTLPGNYGLVNSVGSFSMTTVNSSAAANVRTVTYLTSATDAGTGTAAIVNYLLAAGSYTVMVGGNNTLASDPIGLGNATYAAQILYSTAAAPAAVPVPAAFWLMGTVLAGFRMLGMRKNKLLA